MKLLKLIFCVFVMFITSYTLKTDKEKEIVKLLNDNKISLENLNSDLIVQNKLINVLNKNTVIGIGEATHGTDEFFKIRCEFTKFLITHMGFRTIAIEAGFQECLDLNKYISEGEGNVKELLRKLDQYFWKREEMILFMGWLKEWNRDKNENDKVKIFGFDMQWRKASAECIISYLVQYNPAFYEKLSAQLELIKNTEYIPLSSETFEVIKTIEENLTVNKNFYFESKDDYKIALRNIRILKQAEPFLADREGDRLVFEEIREKYMAENVEWIYSFTQENKMVLWAHNGHVAKGERCGFLNIICYDLMGKYLSERFRDLYFSVGFEFNKGAFLGFYDNVSFRSITLRESPKGTLPYVLSKAGVNNCFVALKNIQENPSGNRFLSKGIGSHSIGKFYYEKRRFEKIGLAEYYDALVFVENSSSPAIFK